MLRKIYILSQRCPVGYCCRIRRCYCCCCCCCGCSCSVKTTLVIIVVAVVGYCHHYTISSLLCTVVTVWTIIILISIDCWYSSLLFRLIFDVSSSSSTSSTMMIHHCHRYPFLIKCVDSLLVFPVDITTKFTMTILLTTTGIFSFSFSSFSFLWVLVIHTLVPVEQDRQNLQLHHS